VGARLSEGAEGGHCGSALGRRHLLSRVDWPQPRVTRTAPQPAAPDRQVHTVMGQHRLDRQVALDDDPHQPPSAGLVVGHTYMPVNMLTCSVATPLEQSTCSTTCPPTVIWSATGRCRPASHSNSSEYAEPKPLALHSTPHPLDHDARSDGDRVAVEGAVDDHGLHCAARQVVTGLGSSPAGVSWAR
jgi:hypothetical protein